MSSMKIIYFVYGDNCLISTVNHNRNTTQHLVEKSFFATKSVLSVKINVYSFVTQSVYLLMSDDSILTLSGYLNKIFPDD